MSPPVAVDAFLDGLVGLGARLVTGVPCSYFAGPLRVLDRGHPRLAYVPAANEGTALATAAGARLGGEVGVVLAQNSGFGNLINPLTSLLLPYRIPAVVFLSLRGWPRPDPGEPQHRWMGQVPPHWLDTLEVPHVLLTGAEDWAAARDAARAAVAARRPVFVLVARNAIAPPPAITAPPPATGAAGGGVTRSELVRAILDEVTGQQVLSTTGYLSRELFNQGDRAGNFYMQGSMGHLLSLALGAAIVRPDRRFVVVDGDGSLIMHMGGLTTIGHVLPANLCHVVFDNGGYESTGGQATAAARTDFAALALACGYRHAVTVDTVGRLRPALREAMACAGPVLVHVRGGYDAAPGGRASESLAPDELATRFQRHLDGPGAAIGHHGDPDPDRDHDATAPGPSGGTDR